MNRNSCYHQNMMPYASRGMGMNNGRGCNSAAEQARPCAERNASPNRYTERASTEHRCGERSMSPDSCGKQTMPERGCNERSMSPDNCGKQTMPERGYSERSMSSDRCSERTSSEHACQEKKSTRCPGEHDWRADVPTGNQKKLLCYIDEVSFAVYEALLYLDTHPNEDEALQYFQEHNKKRNFALKEYAKAYGPLNIGAMDDDASRSWEWACQPWPWEGGNH